MSANRRSIADNAVEARLNDVQLSRADREAAIRHMRIADGVATAIVRGLAFLRGLAQR